VSEFIAVGSMGVSTFFWCIVPSLPVLYYLLRLSRFCLLPLRGSSLAHKQFMFYYDESKFWIARSCSSREMVENARDLSGNITALYTGECVKASVGRRRKITILQCYEARMH